MKRMTKEQENALFGPEDHEGKIVEGKPSLAPWRAEKTYGVDREDNEMCIMAYFPEFDKECRIADVFDPADARLIAAAPELLEALKGLVGAHLAAPGPRGVMLDVPHFLMKAETAIARAEGRNHA